MRLKKDFMTQLDEFTALGLGEKTLPAIKAKGFETPSPIQKLTIPVLLDEDKHNDIIAQAQTGTGKTAAFGLPVLERLTPKKGPVQGLILVFKKPTAERLFFFFVIAVLSVMSMADNHLFHIFPTLVYSMLIALCEKDSESVQDKKEVAKHEECGRSPQDSGVCS